MTQTSNKPKQAVKPVQQDVKTGEQVKQDFFNRGETVHAWALKNQFDPSEVYRVLNGQNKATKGNGHSIAVALGMKPKPQQLAS